jgi:hypothetical protein
MVTLEIHKKNAHISDQEMLDDIKDTEREIKNFKSQVSILIKNRADNKLPIYIAEGRILRREAFIKNLQALLEFRKQLKHNNYENNI